MAKKSPLYCEKESFAEGDFKDETFLQEIVRCKVGEFSQNEWTNAEKMSVV